MTDCISVEYFFFLEKPFEILVVGSFVSDCLWLDCCYFILRTVFNHFGKLALSGPQNLWLFAQRLNRFQGFLSNGFEKGNGVFSSHGH